MTFSMQWKPRLAVALVTLVATLAAGGCEGWLGPADDERRPTVGEMGDDHSETGTPGVPEETEEEEQE